MQRPIRDWYDKTFILAKRYFLENEWQHIPQSIIDGIKANLESQNNYNSHYIILWEVWRYATGYYNIYGLTGLQDFIDDLMRIY